jgi:hypothetical protein
MENDQRDAAQRSSDFAEALSHVIHEDTDKFKREVG